MASLRALRAGRAVIELSLLTGNIEKQLKTLESKMRDFGKGLKSIGSAGLKLSGTMAAMLAFPVKLAADLEKTRAEFTALTGDASKAGKMISELEQFALVTPLSSAGLNEAARQMMLFGVATDDVVGRVKQLGAISAGDEERMQRLAYAFGQVGQAGRLMGTEVRQFIEAGFNPLAEISRTTGESMEDLRERLEAGGISVGEVSKALETATGKGGRFFGLLDKIGKTSIGQLNNLKESFILAVRPLGQELLPLMGKWMHSLKGVIKPLSEWIKGNRELVVSVATLTAKTFVASVALIAIGTTLSSLGATFKALRVAVFLLAGSLKLLYAHPILAGLALLAAAVYGISKAFIDTRTEAAKFQKEMERQKNLRVIHNAPRPNEHQSKSRSAEEGGGGFTEAEQNAHVLKMRNERAKARAQTMGGGMGAMAGMLGGAIGIGQGMLVEGQRKLLEHQFRLGEERAAAQRSIEDEIAREKLAGMKDGLAKELAFINLEHAERLRQLREQGLLTPEMEAQLNTLKAAMEANAGLEGKDAQSRMTEQQAIFDARNIAQTIGGRNEELKQLRQIASNTNPRNRPVGAGIAVV